MATPPLDPAELERRIDAVKKHGVSEAARRLSMSRETLQASIRRHENAIGERIERPYTRPIPSSMVEAPEIPSGDVPIEDVISAQRERHRLMQERAVAHNWPVVKVRSELPIGVMWFGDPHLDDNGCNWALLERHVDLCRTVPGIVGANIGDTTNNWSGRLTRLYADQDTSAATALRLIRWFLCEAGIDWLVWLQGNHDLWGQGAELIRLMNPGHVFMADWQARFRLEFPNGRQVRIHAAHDFPGHSMWNSLHGAQRAAHMRAEADLYIAGHKHSWALHQEESATRDFVYWLARARGYKHVDSYADQLGYDSQREGSSILAVVDPSPRAASGLVRCFADPEDGAEYLTWLRSRRS